MCPVRTKALIIDAFVFTGCFISVRYVKRLVFVGNQILIYITNANSKTRKEKPSMWLPRRTM